MMHQLIWFILLIGSHVVEAVLDPIAEKVVITDDCAYGAYFNEDSGRCEDCLKCSAGTEPNASCGNKRTGTTCEPCALGSYSPDSGFDKCRTQTNCVIRYRTYHYKGDATQDSVCGDCIANYAFMNSQDAQNAKASCASCEDFARDARPAECPKSDSDSGGDDTKGGGDITDKPSVDNGDGDGDDKKPAKPTPEPATDSPLDSTVVKAVAVITGIVLVVSILVILFLVAVRLCPNGDSFVANLPFYKKQTNPPPEGRARSNSVVLPEIIVARSTQPMVMYNRQLSDTVVQLKLFQLQPPDILSSAAVDASDEDLVNLLAAKSSVDQIKWRVAMVQRIFKDTATWTLGPEERARIVNLFLNLDQFTQVQIGRALVDQFKPAVGNRVTMDELVKGVLNNPDTKVYDLVNCVHTHCVDSRLVESLCDELFTSRKNKPSMDTIDESTSIV